MNYLSVCSGIEAATVAWHDLGWNPLGFSEIEKFPSQVLEHHYPQVTNFGDMTKYKEWNINDTVGLLVGGTPCQSFSVAGLRKGLDDPRGNLALTYVGILDKFRPKWCIWENVPGVLSSGNGRDFGAFLGALAELGYGFAYRVLDAQNFGIAQRRRRVFVVGCLGDWESAAKVLFESESLRGNIKTGRGEKKDIANCLTKSPASHSSYNPARSEGNAIVVKWSADIASTLNASFGEKLGLENQHINSGAPLFVQSVYENHGTDSRIKEIAISPTVTARWGTGGNNVPLAQSYCLQGAGATSQNANGSGWNEEKSFTLNVTDVHGVATSFNVNARPDEMKFLKEQSNTLTTSQNSGVFKKMAVRRLTEVECERLQGFPDNYTNIKENCPSGPRYKALGNSMAVPVMRWIGERIQIVENKC